MNLLQTRRNLVLERNKTREKKRNKWSFEIAKDALRKHILENKDQVRKDLEDMKSKSVGDTDIYNYLSFFGELND
jgi:hypothetical protein